MKVDLGFILLALLAVTRSQLNKGCHKNDIVFLMDSSGSQSPAQFNDQIKFVREVVHWFVIGTEHVLVSIISFSLDVIEEFPLNKYTDKESLISAISNVTYQGLLTNTSAALRYVRLNSFLPKNGGRPHVDKLVVLLTDGPSDNQQETVKEAKLLRQNGSVKIYAVGIGQDIDKSELLAITGSKQQIQNAPNSDFLYDILHLFAKKMCKTDGGWSNWTNWSPCSKSCGQGRQIRMRECNNPKPENGGKYCKGDPVEEKQCYLTRCYVCGDYPIDIFFLLDASLSVFAWNFRKELAFVHKFVENSELGEDNLRVGVAVYSTSVYEEFNLNTYYNKSAMFKHLDKIKYNWGLTHTWNALDFARTKAFKAENGGRLNETQVLLVMADGGSNSEYKTTKAADLLSQNKHIQVYTLGIGSRIDLQELHTIASRRENIIISEDGFDGLQGIEEKVRQTICPENRHQ